MQWWGRVRLFFRNRIRVYLLSTIRPDLDALSRLIERREQAVTAREQQVRKDMDTWYDVASSTTSAIYDAAEALLEVRKFLNDMKKAGYGSEPERSAKSKSGKPIKRSAEADGLDN